MTPRPGAAHAATAGKPFALRAQAFPSTAAHCSPTGRSGNINTNNNRREVGPLQASAVGPAQAATPRTSTRTRQTLQPAVSCLETERFDLAWSWLLLSGGAEAPGLCRHRALLTARGGTAYVTG
jgi:hypothetical protein